VIVPPHGRKTVTGLVLISSARVVSVPDWLTRYRMIEPWVQILHSLVDNRASNMTLMIVNDSEEDYLCKSGEVVSTMIPDPMRMVGWYGDEQASQVHRELPLDHVGFISPSKLRVISPSLHLHSNLPGVIDSTVTNTDAERKYCSSVRKFDISDVTSLTKALRLNLAKVSAIADAGEASPIIIQDVVSNQNILAIENCVIEGIRKEGVKKKASCCLLRFN